MKKVPRQRTKKRRKKQRQRNTGKLPWNIRPRKGETRKVKPLEQTQKRAEEAPRM